MARYRLLTAMPAPVAAVVRGTTGGLVAEQVLERARALPGEVDKAADRAP